MTMCSKLTIAIPTFNRVDSALKVLAILDRQTKDSDIQIILADNDSEHGAQLRDYCDEKNIRYIKRKVNLGPGANIMRLFEEAETEWLAILSDDDIPSDEYTSNTLNLINGQESKDVIAYKLKTNVDINQKQRTVNSLSEFSSYNRNTYRLSSTLLISSWIFNRQKLFDCLRYSYLYFGFQAPHLILVIAGLYSKKGALVFSESQTLEHKTPRPNEGWSLGLTYTLMLSALPTIHLLEKQEMIDFANGIIGSSAKKVFGKLIIAKAHNGGNGFTQFASVISMSSVRNRILTKLFCLIYPIIPSKFISRYYFDPRADSDGIKRM